MSKKIIVLGKNGMLGRYVVSYLSQQGYDVVGVGREDFDAVEASKSSDDMNNFLVMMDKLRIPSSLIVLE